MNLVLFAPEDQLCHELHITLDSISGQRLLRSTQDAAATKRCPQKEYHLPGQPRIALKDADIGKYLESELVTRDLDKLGPHLWLIATQDSSHISSLTHQIVRGREIIITEKPELHLVWVYNRVFIKPIPQYLLSHAFWDFYLVDGHSPIPNTKRDEITRAALGFLRSYLYLVRHESDFILATESKQSLIPKHISYSDFISFILAFEKVEDISVSPRYSFGELRLTRLNFWSKIFLRRFTYQKIHQQYGAHFAQYYAPLLFTFGVFSVALSAMQVALAYPTSMEMDQSWISFANVSRGFSIFTLVFVAFLGLLLLVTFFVMVAREIVFALGDLYRKRMSGARGNVMGQVSTPKSMA
jgi:hypothetical protein